MPRPKKPADPVHPAIDGHKKQIKKRRCLKCGREFKSYHSANRICGRCGRILEDVHSPSVYKTELKDASLED